MFQICKHFGLLSALIWSYRKWSFYLLLLLQTDTTATTITTHFGGNCTNVAAMELGVITDCIHLC